MLVWNPNPEIVRIPYLDIPIVWYGVLFAMGFIIGYFIFAKQIQKFLWMFPSYHERDLLSIKKLASFLQCAEDYPTVLEKLNQKIQEDASKRALFDQTLFKGLVVSIQKKVYQITDKVLFYMVLSTIIGARLGHFLFYEKPSEYLKNPIELLKTWEGGLASHGAAISIVLATIFLSRWMRKSLPELNGLKLLDLICVPASLIAVFIRIGNFINQEILGKPTTVFWGVIFKNPIDHSSPYIARHPVQLYESFFYLVTFFILYTLSQKKKYFLANGKIFSLFLILVFSFRFFVEFFKEKQSLLINYESVLTMGQYLSIPLIILGIFLLKTRRFAKVSSM